VGDGDGVTVGVGDGGGVSVGLGVVVGVAALVGSGDGVGVDAGSAVLVDVGRTSEGSAVGDVGIVAVGEDVGAAAPAIRDGVAETRTSLPLEELHPRSATRTRKVKGMSHLAVFGTIALSIPLIARSDLAARGWQNR
jgi:hypothetical protein